METPAFLKPIQSYPGEIVQFIERIPGVDVTGDRETVLERLEPYHKAEVEALGWRWKDLRRAEQVHGTRVALVGDIGSNYPVEGVDSLICSGVSDCVLAIYVADCAAVWLYDKENCHRSLIHSGKAGTAGNIVSNTIKSMKKCLGVDPANLIAVISPCIRPPIMRKTSPRPSRPSSRKAACSRSTCSPPNGPSSTRTVWSPRIPMVPTRSTSSVGSLTTPIRTTTCPHSSVTATS